MGDDAMVTDLSDLSVLPAREMLEMPGEGSDRRWHCFHVRPRREKKVLEAGLEEGIRVYVPLRRSVKEYDGWECEHTVPYFSGYVFGCVSGAESYDLVSTGHIANVLPVHNQEKLLRDLRELEKALEVSRELETFPYIKRGQRVRIERGPFRGVEGVVSERRGKFRVVLNVNFIRKSLSIEMNSEDVEPI